MNNITAQDFIFYVEARLCTLPNGSVVKSIGTNQHEFIIVAQEPSGKEHKFYIPCEE